MLKYFDEENITYETKEDGTIEVQGYITFPMSVNEDGVMTPYDIEIPEKLSVLGSLDLSTTNADHLPSEFDITGGLDISHTKIDTLPDITFNEYLNIAYTRITKLPDNLTVLGDFNATGTLITDIPETVLITGSLDISFSQIEVLHPSLKSIKGLFNMANTKIQVLNDDMIILGSLDASGSQLQALPKNLTCTGVLDITNTSITELPEDFTCMCLTINNHYNFTNIAYRENCGRSKRTIFSVYTNNEYMIVAGCFMGTIEEFKAKAKIDYKDETEYLEYVTHAEDCIQELKEKREA